MSVYRKGGKARWVVILTVMLIVAVTYCFSIPQTYADETIKEAQPPAGSNPADYPKYPAAGSVKMTKSAQWDDEGNSDDMSVFFDIVGASRSNAADVIMVIDRSNSMAVDENNKRATGSGDGAADLQGMTSKLTMAKEAAKTFLDTFMKDPSVGNRVGIISFDGRLTTNDEGRPVTDFVKDESGGFISDKNQLVSAVNGIKYRGGTDYNIALSMAQKFAADRDKTTYKDRPLYVLFMSDGDPAGNNGSAHAKTLRETYGAKFYALGFTSNIDANERGKVEQILNTLASAYDGRFLRPGRFTLYT